MSSLSNKRQKRDDAMTTIQLEGRTIDLTASASWGADERQLLWRHNVGVPAMTIDGVATESSRAESSAKPEFIWVNRQLTPVPPAHVTRSYGILMYRRRRPIQEEEEEGNGNDPDKNNNDSSSSPPVLEYLLGLIPQRNFWTVFKGVPDDSGHPESPEQVAMREFEEETSVPFPYPNLTAVTETTLHGMTSGGKNRKLLCIALVEAPTTKTTAAAAETQQQSTKDGANNDNPQADQQSSATPSTSTTTWDEQIIQQFDVDKVVKIDNGPGGYMNGQPEIVQIRWLTAEQALQGMGREKVKIYKSQAALIQQAQAYLQAKVKSAMKEEPKSNSET